MLTHAMLVRKREHHRLARMQKSASRARRRARSQTFYHPDLTTRYEPAIGREVPVLEAPEVLNLRESLPGLLNFLRAVRRCSRGLKGNVFVDLKTIREITPAAAILLVAEFDRWREVASTRRLRAVDAEAWNPRVRQRLLEMGFFDLLRARCPVSQQTEPDGEVFLRFLTGRGSEGLAAKRLREGIEALGAPIADRDALYDGLVEAMTNVRHHAYKRRAPIKRWWMSASVDVSRRRLVVMFLDHGVGIPRTLPRSTLWEDLRGNLSFEGIATILKDDARLIETAVTAQRSKTGEGHRGHGLKDDVKGYIDAHTAYGRLRILSRRGLYLYERSPDKSERTSLAALPLDFEGTFIEWTIQDYDDGHAN